MADRSFTMSALDVINTRCSVRSYKPDLLDRETITRLLRLAVRAPTAIHEEQWVFAVVQGKDALKHFSDLVRAPFAAELQKHKLENDGHTLDHFKDPDFNLFYDASILILLCAQPMGAFVASDCWLAAENLMLAAHAMGLGTCVIGSAVMGFNLPAVKAELGIAEEISVVVPIIVGVPAAQTAVTPRRDPVIIAWHGNLA
jgi:nitroreductase